jgi:hypothetical protein
LAIARGFARAHGGDLTCEQPPPGTPGAVFRLLLPIGDVTVAPTVRFQPDALPGFPPVDTESLPAHHRGPTPSASVSPEPTRPIRPDWPVRLNP